MSTGVYRRKTSPYFWITYLDSDRIRRREGTGTTSKSEAANIREDKLAAVRAGKLTFDDSGRKKTVLFKNFAMVAVMLRAGSKFGGYTERDIDILLTNDRAGLKSLTEEVLEAERTGSRPRFKFKSTQTYFTRVKALLAYFGKKDVRSIDSELVSSYIEFRKADITGASINRELSTLSNIYGWGIDAKEFRQMNYRNPVRLKLHQQREADPKIRYWTQAERIRILKECEEAPVFVGVSAQLIADICEVGWTIGMRIKEILHVNVGQVNFELGRAELKGYQTKNGKDRPVPFFTDRVREIFTSRCLNKKSDDLVFDLGGGRISYSAFSRSFEKIVGKAGMKDVNIHSLRKTAAIDLAAYRGKDHIAVMAILGHSDFRTSLRYLEPSLVEELRSRS
jgi:integrase